MQNFLENTAIFVAGGFIGSATASMMNFETISGHAAIITGIAFVIISQIVRIVQKS